MLQYSVQVFFWATMKDQMGDDFLCFFPTVTSIFAKIVF